MKNQFFQWACILFVLVLLVGGCSAPEAPEPEAKPQPGNYFETVNGARFNMVYVAGGKFRFGKPAGTSSIAGHEVSLDGYYMCETEVTQALWLAVMGDRPSCRYMCDGCPVELVSWDDVQQFLAKLGQLTGKRYRLPTEAEWEYAAKGGVKSKDTPFAGGLQLNDVAWNSANSGQTTNLVASKKPNELGLYDMSGNVWEWCNDWFLSTITITGRNPQGPEAGVGRVLRGGSYNNDAAGSTTVTRIALLPYARYSNLGFRFVVSQ